MKELREEIEHALTKVEDLLHDAEILIEHERYTALANRTYYMAYTCLVALFFSKDIFVKTHKGAFSKFGELFVGNEPFTSEHASILGLLFSKRQQADYDLDCDISHSEAKMLLAQASEFYAATKTYLQHNV